jgi:HlyD family secretion protein
MSAVYPVKRFVWQGMLALLVLVGGFGGWSVATQITGAVIASGQVEVEQSRRVVQHPDGGVVAEIAVSEGETVAPGQVLIRLDGTLLLSELAIVETQFFEVLARRGRLTAERDGLSDITWPAMLLQAFETHAQAADLADGQERLFVARAETLGQQIEQLTRRRAQSESQLAGIAAQREAARAQRALIAQELAAQQGLLDQGLAQASRVLALQREEARLTGALGALDAEEAQVEGRITEFALEILTLSTQRREQAQAELRDLGLRELELAERRRALLERIDRLDIRAPLGGIVLGLQVNTTRAVLRPAEPALYIVPQDRPLVIAARIDPRDIDEVFVGQQTVLMFSGFSARTIGELLGVVTLVSADAFVDERFGMTYYRAEIVLTPEARAELGDRPILPGMPVEAYIRTGARSPLDYLTRPLTDYFTRAFRES